MELGVVTLSLGCLDFPSLLQFLKDMEPALWSSAQRMVFTITHDFTAEGRRAIADKVRSEGLSIVSLGGYSDFTIAILTQSNSSLSS